MPKKGYKQTKIHRDKIKINKVLNRALIGNKNGRGNKGKIPWNKGMKGYKISGGHIPWNKGLTKETDERVKRNAQNKSGKNHPCWIENRELLTRHLRNDPEYKQWSKKVKNRDNWKCRINNKDCLGKVIAHHILSWSNFPELRYKINNGITLCLAHHPRKRAEEKRLIPLLQGLVSVSNETICHTQQDLLN